MRIDLTAPSYRMLREIPVGDVTVMQSMTFTGTAIYVLQLVAGGHQLPGEPESLAGSVRAARGDLSITELDLDGNITGHMWLLGSGHGVAIGLEVDGSATHLWTETDSQDIPGFGGRGTALCRFEFADGAVLYPCSPNVEVYPFDLGGDVTPSIDGNDTLAVRYDPGDGSHRFVVYDLAAFKAGDREAVNDVPAPVPEFTFQGWTIFGDYLYTVEGDPYGSNGSVSPYGNTTLTVLERSTGAVVDRRGTRAAYSLDYREPEGLAIQQTAGGPRLCMGFASGPAGARLASIYYKDAVL